MTHHEEVGVHCVQGQGGVDQGFAFFDRRRLHVHVHNVGAEAFAGQFETGLGAGRVFEEHVDLGETLQRVVVFVGAAIEINVGLGEVQEGGDLVRGEVFDPQKVAGAKRHGRQPFDFAVYRTSFGLRKGGLAQFTF